MNAAINTSAITQEILVMSLAVAELGAMKLSVDSLAYSRNKTDQTKTAKLVVSFLSQISRVKGGKALNNIKLLSYNTRYSLEEDDLFYDFFYFNVPQVQPSIPVVVPDSFL